MILRLLPRSADNAYRGHRLALWLFGLLLVMKAAMGVNSIFNGHFVASAADGIPLDTFTPAGAQAVVAMFAAWGLSQALMSLLGLLALLRYRAMVPLAFALLLLEHLARKLVFHFLPIVTSGKAPGSSVNLVLFALEIAGLALSLWRRGEPRPQG